MNILTQEKLLHTQGNLEAFWKSRLDKKDPVARICYALWVSDTEKLKVKIRKSDSAFWNHKCYSYWEIMARSTVINLVMRLNKGGFRDTSKEMREQIKEVGKQRRKLSY